MISPGEVFYDVLPDGRYERCVLQKTDGSETDRHAAARGGTGEFYRKIPQEELEIELRKDESHRLDESVLIMDTSIGSFVFLERIADD